VRGLLLLGKNFVLLAFRGGQTTPLFSGAFREGLVGAAGSVGGVAGITGVLARVFATEDDKGVPRTGYPIGIAQAVANGSTVRGGEGETGRRIYVRRTIGMVDGGSGGWRGLVKGG
jgi:hypothetical protein